MKFLVVFAILATSAYASQLGFRLHERLMGTASPRVVGGQDAEKGDFPYQVSLQWGIGPYFQHVCGGSIIAKNIVITAGHCKTELPAGDYQIVAGINDLYDESGQTIKVAKFIVNPAYDGGVNPNDIAIAVLESSLELNDFVKLADLPKSGDIPTGAAKISGWGSTSTGSFPTMPSILQFDSLDLVSIDECKKSLIAITGSSAPLVDTNICTLTSQSGKGACSGDSGGPLAQGNVVIGIVSWGFIPCGGRNHPSVFTRVSAFTDFINESIKF